MLLCFCCASTLARAPLGVRARSLVARPSETLSGVVPYGFNSTFWRSQNGLRSATVRLKSWTCIIFSKFFSPSAADDARASRPWPVVPRRDVARGRDERASAAAGGGTRRIFEPCSSARARGRRSLARQPSVAAAVPGVRRKRLALAIPTHPRESGSDRRGARHGFPELPARAFRHVVRSCRLARRPSVAAVVREERRKRLALAIPTHPKDGACERRSEVRAEERSNETHEAKARITSLKFRTTRPRTTTSSAPTVGRSRRPWGASEAPRPRDSNALVGRRVRATVGRARGRPSGGRADDGTRSNG